MHHELWLVLAERMPLVLAFFTTGDRVNSLFDRGLQEILEARTAVGSLKEFNLQQAHDPSQHRSW